MRHPNYKASSTPELTISHASYPGQPENMRRFVPGYDHYLEAMPLITPGESLFAEKVAYAGAILTNLGHKLSAEMTAVSQRPKTFSRDILAIEGISENSTKAEIIVAHWGQGFVSPVHGHVAGFHYENLIRGKFRAHTYRQVDPASKTVRLVKTEIVKRSGPFVSTYEEQPEGNTFERPLMIHNFEALEESHSLHFIPEHSLDGMGNGFTPEYFEDVHSLQIAHMTEITALQGMYMPIGSVILVRSINVPDYGDHFIVITGKPVVKEHGLRPQDHVIQAPNAARILNPYTTPSAYAGNPTYESVWSQIQTPGLIGRDLVLLLLNEAQTKNFYQFHDITLEGDKVTFPKH